MQGRQQKQKHMVSQPGDAMVPTDVESNNDD